MLRGRWRKRLLKTLLFIHLILLSWLPKSLLLNVFIEKLLQVLTKKNFIGFLTHTIALCRRYNNIVRELGGTWEHGVTFWTSTRSICINVYIRLPLWSPISVSAAKGANLGSLITQTPTEQQEVLFTSHRSSVSPQTTPLPSHSLLIYPLEPVMSQVPDISVPSF